MEPGSDVANLSLLGYDPALYHTGRSPLEAASMGVDLDSSQTAFRMNLVTLEHRSDDEIFMISHSSGDISTGEAVSIVNDLKKIIENSQIDIYPGVAYRHLLVWKDAPEGFKTIPPHDVLDQNMAAYLDSSSENPVVNLMKRSWELLANHPVNRQRRSSGKNEANSIWLWGQGKAPEMPLFLDRFGLKGGVISAVDLIKGIGVYAGFEPIQVKGATGYIDTNYKGKAEGALKGLLEMGMDFIFLHVEAPDEAAHNGNYKEKIRAIESFDKEVVGAVLEGLNECEDYHIAIASDHYTPIIKKTHTMEPAPFCSATRRELEEISGGNVFTERAAIESGVIFDAGHEFMPAFIRGFQG
jgi:2,3-bisphosphoglycerate-independent phosphoglycerate mutase